MDIPFSSLVGTSSVVRVPSNTGGFGGVMLQEVKVKKKSHTSLLSVDMVIEM